MRIYGDNVILNSTLVASSTKSGYKVDNLKEPQLRRQFSFDGNSGNIVIMFNQIETVKHCIVDIGTMSEGATVTLEGNSSDSWASPPYSESLNSSESSFYLDLDQTYKYFRLVIEDSTVSAVGFGYISIGGDYTQMPPINYKAELFYNTTSENQMSIGGQMYGDEGYEYLETTFKFPMIEEEATTFNGVTVATRNEIKELYLSVRNITPVWVMLWASNLDEYPPVFCVFNQKKISFKKVDYAKVYSTSLSLREVL